MKYQILNGDNIEILKTLPDNSIDSIITDPPYGIAFLGKDWDHKKATETTTKIAQLHNLPSGMKHTTLADDLEFQYWLRERWIECLRVLKPGGHLLAFSAARTYHHMAMSLQTAGFEIRDQIMWIYSSGFPKSQDVGRSIQRSLGVKEYEKMVDTTKNAGFGQTDHARVRAGEEWSTPAKQVGQVKVTDPEAKAWEGWGTALKPAHEPICLARKPSKLSIAQNVQRWGTGALNIDATRIPYADENDIKTYLNNKAGPAERGTGKHGENINMFEKSVGYKNIKKKITKEEDLPEQGRFPSNVIGEIAEPYQKYFYCPKVSRAERHMGHEMPPAMFGNVQGCYDPETGERFAVGFDNRANIATEDKKGNGIDRVCETCGVSILKPQDCHCPTKSWVRPIKSGNNHPTVKPIELMKYLIKLVTPPNGRVLDPFNGSGSTGMAAVELGHEYIGIEQDEKYCEISRKRIAAHFKKSDPLRASGLFD